jgi:carboxymethylenebutenolidase
LAATLAVVETEVTVKTPDGVCDAAFIHPASGAYPGVIFWPDALGLRPSMRDMAKRLAAEGYSVLVPNPFYRISKAPQFTTGRDLDFKNPDTMTKIGR